MLLLAEDIIANIDYLTYYTFIFILYSPILELTYNNSFSDRFNAGMIPDKLLIGIPQNRLANTGKSVQLFFVKMFKNFQRLLKRLA